MEPGPVRIDTLQEFVHLAAVLHFHKAAEELGLSQSTLTHHIQLLEHAIGMRLFYRNRRGVSLTPAGEAFLQRTVVTLANHAEAIARAQRARQGDDGDRLRIGHPATLRPRLLSSTLRALRADHPNLAFELTENSSSMLLNQLRADQLDLVLLVRRPVSDSSIESAWLYDEPLVVMLPNDHPLTIKEYLNADDLRGYPLILCLPDVLTEFGDVQRALEMSGLAPSKSEHANAYSSVSILVRSGLCLALLPVSASFRLIGQTLLTKHLISPDILLPVSIAWRRNESSPIVDEARSVLTHVLRTL